MKKFTQDEVNSILWRAYDSFKYRENIHVNRDYLLTIFFIKYITDRSIDEDFDIIQVDDKSSFHYIYSNKYSNDIGDLINQGLRKLEENNPSKLGGVFQQLDYNSEEYLGNWEERNEVICNVLEEINSLNLNKNNLEDSNIPANSFAQFIEATEFELSRKMDNNYTPMELGRLVVDLINPEKEESIYDPSCGIGAIIAAAFNKTKGKETKIFGQVKDERLFRLCKINMILNDIKNEDIKLGDVIGKPAHIVGNQLQKFDVVLSYPLYMVEKWTKIFEEKNKEGKFAMKEELDPYNRFLFGLPPSNSAEYVYILHMINSMSEYGRMGIITYSGVLFRGGGEGKIRKNIIDENLLDAIIMLPERMLVNTSVSPVILLFRKKRKIKDILMIDASSDKYIFEGRHINKFQPHIVDKIVDTYNNFYEYSGFSRKVSIEEIHAKDYNLYIPKYLLPLQETKRRDINQIKQNILRIKAKLAEVEYEIESLINKGI